jgi:hypothetical protein
VIKSENKSELRAFDDNWIIGNSGLNSLELTSCWSPELTAEHIDLRYCPHFVQILNSTPFDVTFGSAELAKRSGKYYCIWSTYKNGQEMTSVNFERKTEAFTQPKFHNGKLYIGKLRFFLILNGQPREGLSNALLIQRRGSLYCERGSTRWKVTDKSKSR